MLGLPSLERHRQLTLQSVSAWLTNIIVWRLVRARKSYGMLLLTAIGPVLYDTVASSSTFTAAMRNFFLMELKECSHSSVSRLARSMHRWECIPFIVGSLFNDKSRRPLIFLNFFFETSFLDCVIL